MKKMKFFKEDDWVYYLSKYNFDYKDIIENDEELKHLIYQHYKKDFIEFKY
jgi:hypothetical protein